MLDIVPINVSTAPALPCIMKSLNRLAAPLLFLISFCKFLKSSILPFNNIFAPLPPCTPNIAFSTPALSAFPILSVTPFNRSIIEVTSCKFPFSSVTLPINCSNLSRFLKSFKLSKTSFKAVPALEPVKPLSFIFPSIA